jgi:hypothetical protein
MQYLFLSVVPACALTACNPCPILAQRRISVQRVNACSARKNHQRVQKELFPSGGRYATIPADDFLKK